MRHGDVSKPRIATEAMGTVLVAYFFEHGRLA